MATTYRPGVVADGPAVYDVFVESTIDLERRMGLPTADIIWLQPDFVASYWQRRQSLFDHLARTADQFWVAEQDGQIVGFARSSVRDGVREAVGVLRAARPSRPGHRRRAAAPRLPGRQRPTAGDHRHA